MANEAVTRSVSPDRAYIDFTRANFGVRVWRDKCQAIARTNSESEWLGRELAETLPADDSFRNLRLGAGLQPVPAIAFEIGSLGSEELRKLASGELVFEDAISSL